MKKMIFAIIMILLAFTAGCGETVSYIEKESTRLLPLSKPNDYNSLIAQTDDSLILLKYEEGAAVYYRYYFDTDKKIRIGKVENHFVSTANTAYIDDTLYFFVTKREEGAGVNYLYSIDLTNNKLTLEYSEKRFQTFNYMIVRDEKIIVFKGDLSDDGQTAVSYLEEYDPKTKKQTVLLVFDIDFTQSARKTIRNIDSYNNFFYLLVEEFENEKYEHFIYIYDSHLEYIEKIDLSNISEIFTSPPGDLKVFEDYLYISNFSNRAFWVKLHEIPSAQDNEILHEFNIAKELVAYDQSILFFQRNTSTIYLMDKDSGVLKSAEFPYVPDGYYISYVTRDSKDNITVYLLSEENQRLLYHSTIADVFG
ncbi:MAG: hypothetical protein FWG31_01505 [Oscillospiraceae bacterium]|nr:hypothetical protein [Oscillospiraceae bacterium]